MSVRAGADSRLALSFRGCFGDRRIDRLASLMLERMSTLLTVTLRKLATSRREQVAFYRLMNNDRFDVDKIIEGAVSKTASLSKNANHVLVIQDSTDIFFEVEGTEFRTGLGQVGNEKGLGFNLHPSLVVDAESGQCLGLSSLYHWVREERQGSRIEKKCRRQKVPIEERESYRWIENAEASKKTLGTDMHKTIIADRESDIYEEWSRIPDATTNLITRSCYDRNLSDDSKLYGRLASSPLMHRYAVNLPAITGKRKARKAHMELRFCPVEIKRPKNCKDSLSPKTISLFAIEVKETRYLGDKTDKPVHWRLLTSHRVEAVNQAMQIVAWYIMRWQIEQLFRVLKRQGLNIEASLLESCDRLRKLAVLALVAATTVMQLTLAREKKDSQPITNVFDDTDKKFLTQLNKKLQGSTEKQKNKNSRSNLAWASWIIARLGGWTGYASERPPGPITMKNGLDRYYSLKEGWLMGLPSHGF
jgi:hypothetical protein